MPVFLPGKFPGKRSLAGYSLGGCRESDSTQRLNNNKIKNLVVFLLLSSKNSLYILEQGICLYIEYISKNKGFPDGASDKESIYKPLSIAGRQLRGYCNNLCKKKWWLELRQSQCSAVIGFWIFLKEKTMAPHSSTLAWKIPWTEEPGRLQSMESRRVRHN